MSPFLSDCPSLMLGIAIPCIQHSQALLERGVCELAHSFFHFILNSFEFFVIEPYRNIIKNNIFDVLTGSYESPQVSDCSICTCNTLL